MSQLLTRSNVLPGNLKNCRNEYVAILSENSTLKEKLTAIYLKAMERVRDYSFQYPPHEPAGFFRSYELYKNASAKEKSDAWKYLQETYSGYFKEKYAREVANSANKFFLEEMMKHFSEIGLENYVQRIEYELAKFKTENKNAKIIS